MTKLKVFNGFHTMSIEQEVNDFIKDKVFIQSVVTETNQVLIFYQEKIVQ